MHFTVSEAAISCKCRSWSDFTKFSSTTHPYSQASKHSSWTPNNTAQTATNKRKTACNILRSHVSTTLKEKTLQCCFCMKACDSQLHQEHRSECRGRSLQAGYYSWHQPSSFASSHHGARGESLFSKQRTGKDSTGGRGPCRAAVRGAASRLRAYGITSNQSPGPPALSSHLKQHCQTGMLCTTLPNLAQLTREHWASRSEQT